MLRFDEFHMGSRREIILSTLGRVSDGLSLNALQTGTGIGKPKLSELLGALIAAGTVERTAILRAGRKCDGYRLTSSPAAESALQPAQSSSAPPS